MGGWLIDHTLYASIGVLTETVLQKVARGGLFEKGGGGGQTALPSLIINSLHREPRGVIGVSTSVDSSVV